MPAVSSWPRRVVDVVDLDGAAVEVGAGEVVPVEAATAGTTGTLGCPAGSATAALAVSELVTAVDGSPENHDSCPEVALLPSRDHRGSRSQANPAELPAAPVSLSNSNCGVPARARHRGVRRLGCLRRGHPHLGGCDDATDVGAVGLGEAVQRAVDEGLAGLLEHGGQVGVVAARGQADWIDVEVELGGPGQRVAAVDAGDRSGR